MNKSHIWVTIDSEKIEDAIVLKGMSVEEFSHSIGKSIYYIPYLLQRRWCLKHVLEIICSELDLNIIDVTLNEEVLIISGRGTH